MQEVVNQDTKSGLRLPSCPTPGLAVNTLWLYNNLLCGKTSRSPQRLDAELWGHENLQEPADSCRMVTHTRFSATPHVY